MHNTERAHQIIQVERQIKRAQIAFNLLVVLEAVIMIAAIIMMVDLVRDIKPIDIEAREAQAIEYFRSVVDSDNTSMEALILTGRAK